MSNPRAVMPFEKIRSDDMKNSLLHNLFLSFSFYKNEIFVNSFTSDKLFFASRKVVYQLLHSRVSAPEAVIEDMFLELPSHCYMMSLNP